MVLRNHHPLISHTLPRPLAKNIYNRCYKVPRLYKIEHTLIGANSS